MRRILLLVAALLGATAPAAAQTTTIRPDRVFIGTSLTVGAATTGTDPVRLVGLPAKGAETTCLWIDGTGDVATGTCVSSVGLSLPNLFTVTGSPVTTSGTLTAALADQAANTVFARSTGTGVPSFQALTDAMVPDNLTLGTVGGTPTFSNAVTFNGNVDLKGTLADSTGNLTIGDSVDLTGTLAVTGAATVSTTLGVTGATTLSSTLDVRGAVSDGGGTLELNDAVDISGTTTHSGTTQGAGWASKTTAWGITAGGDADFRGLFSDELRVKLFTTELSQAFNGSLIVSKSVAEIAQAFTCPALGAAETLWVRDFAATANIRVFMVNDKVQIRTMAWSDPDTDGGAALTISDCVGTVTNYTDGTAGAEGQQSWTFTRGTSASGGGMADSTVIPVDTQVLDFGVAGDGFVEVVANDGADNVNAPYVGIVTWGGAGPIAANRIVRARLGNLLGITSTDEYGLLAGTYAASNGSFFRASDQNFDLHNITLKLWDGTTNTIALVPGAAPYIAIGNPAPTAFATGTGFWCGDDGGTYKCRIGNPAGDRMEWTGTALAVVGDGDGITNIDGGNLQNLSVQTGALAAGAVTAAKISAVTGGTNLIPKNSSFESAAVGGWATYIGMSAPASDATFVYHGAYAISGTADGTQASPRFTMAAGNRAAVVVGAPYVATVRVIAASGQCVFLGTKYFTTQTIAGEAGTGPSVTGAGAGGGTWVTLTLPFTPTHGYVALTPGLCSTPANGTALYVDAAQVQAGEVATGYSPSAGEGLLVGDTIATSSTCGTSGTCVQLTGTGLQAYDGTDVQFAIDAATGTATAGGGAVVLDADGLTFSSVDQTQSSVNWAAGQYVRGWGTSTAPNLKITNSADGARGPGEITIVSNSTEQGSLSLFIKENTGTDNVALDLLTTIGLKYVGINGGANVLPFYADGGEPLGTSSKRWGAFYGSAADFAGHVLPSASNTYDLGSSTRLWSELWLNLTATGTAYQPAVIDPVSGQTYIKNDGLSGTTSCGAGQAVKTITFEYGIATAITCGAP